MSFDEMYKQATAIPWGSAAGYWLELRSVPVEVPPEVPPLTKEALAKLIKLGLLTKTAQTPEQAQEMAQRQMMTDPATVAALDQQQMIEERNALIGQVNQLQADNEVMQQELSMADQQAQEQQLQSQDLSAQLEQESVARQAATTQAVQARDQAMQVETDMQQHRMQLMQQADQLALQLKQIASQPPPSEQAAMMAQQSQEQMAQQEQMAAQAGAAPAGGGEPPASSESAKEEKEAVQAQDEAAKQTAQADQAKAKDQAKMQGQPPTVNVNMAPPTPGGEAMPKQGASVKELAAVLKEKRAALGKCSGCGKMTKLSELGKCSGCSGVHKTAAGEAAMKELGESVAKRWATRGAGAGVGAATGAVFEAAQQARHKGKYGPDVVSDRELDLKNKLDAARIKAKRDPTYLNKLRVATLKSRVSKAKAGREHPGAATLSAAAKGALVGGLVAPSAARLGGKVVKSLKDSAAARQAAAEAVS